ncbi:hypothetical protein IE077_000922 [Cardiosporidium cionae]|uniref:Uncharacterized protein n=1 Tax=Cardiosporidium cionae TaxID=476202 RepID=A0ABQ7JDR9_9APIC|nr:hypothetical protein IE077_000922 [Cardiosporidium cionae]|eukprot:KAF8822148.1 hypothetical protein IE077_000922 [Cardiosporidium cionae]
MQIARGSLRKSSLTILLLFITSASLFVLAEPFAASATPDLEINPRRAINEEYKDEYIPVTSDATVKENTFILANGNEATKILPSKPLPKEISTVAAVDNRISESSDHWNQDAISSHKSAVTRKDDHAYTRGDSLRKEDPILTPPIDVEESVGIKEYSNMEMEKRCAAWYNSKTSEYTMDLYPEWISFYINKFPRHLRFVFLGIFLRWKETVIPIMDFAVHKFSGFVGQAISVVGQNHLRLSARQPYIWNPLLMLFSVLMVTRLFFGKFWPFGSSKIKRKDILRKDTEFIENMVKRINWLCERAASTIEKGDTSSRTDLGGLFEELAMIKTAFDLRQHQLSDLNFQVQQLGAFMYLHTAVVAKCLESQPEKRSPHMLDSIPEVENFVIGGNKMGKEFHSWCNDFVKPIVANWLQAGEEPYALDHDPLDFDMLGHVSAATPLDNHNDAPSNENASPTVEKQTFLDAQAKKNAPISTYRGEDERLHSTLSHPPPFHFAEQLHGKDIAPFSQAPIHRHFQAAVGDSFATPEVIETQDIIENQARIQLESSKFLLRESPDYAVPVPFVSPEEENFNGELHGEISCHHSLAENAYSHFTSSEAFGEDMNGRKNNISVPNILESSIPHPTQGYPLSNDQPGDTRILGHPAPIIPTVSFPSKEKSLTRPLRYIASNKEYSKVDAHTDPFSVRLRSAQTSS